MKEFRVVINQNPSMSSGFWGGRSAASVLSYYYKCQSEGRVILGTSLEFRGLGTYREAMKRFIKAGQRLEDQNEVEATDVVFGNRGYVYLPYDPIYPTISSGISASFKIEEIRPSRDFSSEEISKWRLGSTLITRGRELDSGLYVVASQVSISSTSINGRSPVAEVLAVLTDDGRRSRFFDAYTGLTKRRKCAFVLAEHGEWGVVDDVLRSHVVDQSKLAPISVVDYLIKRNRIRESLVHSVFSVLASHADWYLNFEVPIGRDRIDFLVKEGLDPSEPFKLIEVKLGGAEEAIEQLESYVKRVEREVLERRGNSEYFFALWDEERCAPKPLVGVILCGHEDDDAIRHAKERGFGVWTYHFTISKDLSDPSRPVLGMTVSDLDKGRVLLST